MFGSGFIEMLARQMTRELQAIRDTIASGGSASLVAKGISFGVLSRRADGAWGISGVEGIPAVSLVSAGASQPPSLVIRPFHQAGRVVSLREFSKTTPSTITTASKVRSGSAGNWTIRFQDPSC